MAEKTEDEFLQELVNDNNENNTPISEERLNKWKQYYRRVETQLDWRGSVLIENGLHPLAKTPINKWTKSNIYQWRLLVGHQTTLIKDEAAALPELIAIASRAMTLATGKTPRQTQIYALIMAMENSDNMGMIIQVSTGEGKSLILAMCAVIFAMRLHYVDIVTSSSVLAKRDAEDAGLRKFYEIFNLTIAHNVDERKCSGHRKCYDANIVYGDENSFMADHLRQKFHGNNVRGTRSFAHVLVDEADKLKLDDNLQCKKLMLSTKIPGSEYLGELKVQIWTLLHQILSNISWNEEKKCYIYWELNEIEQMQEQQNDETQSQQQEPKIEAAHYVEDLDKFIFELLRNFLKEQLDKDDTMNTIPIHLREYAKQQADAWARNAILAEKMIENEGYLVREDEKGIKRISVVDNENTGIVEINMHMSNGLHEFLEIKHSLKMNSETLTTSFHSNFSFFANYGHHITAITGTIGSASAQQLLKKLYPSLDIKLVPRYKKMQFKREETFIATGREEWLEKIHAKIVLKTTLSEQAVLLICNTIDAVFCIQAFLLQKGIAKNRIKLYIRNDDVLLGENVLDRPVHVEEIILATNLAGRGTDLQTTKELDKNGGLHVILSFLPKNVRVECQAFGRTSRQGRPGSGQLILDLGQLKEQFNVSIENLMNLSGPQIDNLLDQIRNRREELLLNVFYEKRYSCIKIEDQLFDKFCEFMQKLRNKNFEANSPEMMQIEERWGFWLHELKQSWKDKSAEERKTFSLERFAKFIDQLENEATNAAMLFHNPCYLIKKGCNSMMARNYSDAINSLSLAIEKDANFAYVAYYYRALAHIQHDGNRDKAAKDLSMAESIIGANIVSRINGIDLLANRKADSDFSMQCKAKLNVIRKLTRNIDAARKVLEDGTKDGKKETKWLQDISLEDTFPKGEGPQDEIDEFERFGLSHFYELHNADPPPNWKAVFFLAMCSAVQIGLGIAAFCSGHPYVAFSLVRNGLQDAFRAIRVAAGETYNFGKWVLERGISYCIDIVARGFSWIKSKLPTCHWAKKVIDIAGPILSAAYRTIFNAPHSFDPAQFSGSVGGMLALNFIEIAEAEMRGIRNTLFVNKFVAKDHSKPSESEPAPPTLSYDGRYQLVKRELLGHVQQIVTNSEYAQTGLDFQQIFANWLLLNLENAKEVLIRLIGYTIPKQQTKMLAFCTQIDRKLLRNDELDSYNEKKFLAKFKQLMEENKQQLLEMRNNMTKEIKTHLRASIDAYLKQSFRSHNIGPESDEFVVNKLHEMGVLKFDIISNEICTMTFEFCDENAELENLKPLLVGWKRKILEGKAFIGELIQIITTMLYNRLLRLIDSEESHVSKKDATKLRQHDEENFLPLWIAKSISDGSTDKAAEFTQTRPCEHKAEKFMAQQMLWKVCPFVVGAAHIGATGIMSFGLAASNGHMANWKIFPDHGPRHHYVEIVFKCQECSHTFHCLYEFTGHHSKMHRFGNYAKSYRTEQNYHFSRNVNFWQVQDRFDVMWGGKWHFNKTCIDWARDFYNKVALAKYGN